MGKKTTPNIHISNAKVSHVDDYHVPADSGLLDDIVIASQRSVVGKLAVGLSTVSASIAAFNAQAATFTVDTTAQGIDGTDGKMSLEEAVLEANATIGIDTIDFNGPDGSQINVKYSYYNKYGLVIDDDLIIDGSSVNNLQLTASDRYFSATLFKAVDVNLTVKGIQLNVENQTSLQSDSSLIDFRQVTKASSLELNSVTFSGSYATYPIDTIRAVNIVNDATSIPIHVVATDVLITDFSSNNSTLPVVNFTSNNASNSAPDLVSFTGVQVTNNFAQNILGFVSDAIDVNFIDISVSNNSCSDFCGLNADVKLHSKLEIVNSSFSNNTISATGVGAGLRLLLSGAAGKVQNVNLTSVVANNNSADENTGLDLIADGLGAEIILSITGGEFNDNTATSGSNAGFQVAVSNLAKTTISGLKVSNNNADFSNAGLFLRAMDSYNLSVVDSQAHENSAGYDAAGMDFSLVNSSLSISGVDVQNNDAKYAGVRVLLESNKNKYKYEEQLTAKSIIISNSVVSGNVQGASVVEGYGAAGMMIKDQLSTAQDGANTQIIISNSAINNNQNLTGQGAGLSVLSSPETDAVVGAESFVKGAELTVFNTTISGNISDSGSGVYLAALPSRYTSYYSYSSETDRNTLQATIVNSTIANNKSKGIGGGVMALGQDDAQPSLVELNLFNSIISDNQSQCTPVGVPIMSWSCANTSGVDLAMLDRAHLNSVSHNIIETIVSGDLGKELDNITPAVLASIDGNITAVDPQLELLADNGGVGLSHSLMLTSAAIGIGEQSHLSLAAVKGLSIATDMRGEVRVLGDEIDMGALEIGGEGDFSLLPIEDVVVELDSGPQRVRFYIKLGDLDALVSDFDFSFESDDVGIVSNLVVDDGLRVSGSDTIVVTGIYSPSDSLLGNDDLIFTVTKGGASNSITFRVTVVEATSGEINPDNIILEAENSDDEGDAKTGLGSVSYFFFALLGLVGLRRRKL